MSRPRLIADGDSLLNYNVAVSGVVQLYPCCYQFKCQICLTYPCAISLLYILTTRDGIHRLPLTYDEHKRCKHYFLCHGIYEVDWACSSSDNGADWIPSNIAQLRSVRLSVPSVPCLNTAHLRAIFTTEHYYQKSRIVESTGHTAMHRKYSV